MVQIKQYRHKNNLTDIVKVFLTYFISLFRFYNPLKKSENLRFFAFFRKYRNGILGQNGLV